MRLRATPLPGAFVLEPEPFRDDRGFFTRVWSAKDYAANGLDPKLAHYSVSHNTTRGTLRGMHWQGPPHAEAKTLRCSAGAIFDVAVDVRRDSPTFLRWTGVELSAENRLSFYVPPLCAHGFITLTDDVDVEYAISAEYVPESARGLRWDDPRVHIEWPLAPTVISERDRTYPLLAKDGP